MKQTPFYDVHVKSNAVMIDQDGWRVPDHYGQPDQELIACREGLAVFDLSHHYRLRVDEEAGRVLPGVFRDFPKFLAEGRQCRAVLAGEGPAAGCLVQHHEGSYLIMGEPGGYSRMVTALEQATNGIKLKVKDETDSTSTVALAGPKAMPLLKEKLPFDLSDLGPNDVRVESIFFMRVTVAMLDGPVPIVMLIFSSKIASMAWDMLVKYGQSRGAILAGQTTYRTLLA